jgi:hypothetical protein
MPTEAQDVNVKWRSLQALWNVLCSSTRVAQLHDIAGQSVCREDGEAMIRVAGNQ